MDPLTTFLIDSNKVTPFFQKTYLKKMSKNVANVDYSEEAEFEQLLIADNWDSKEWIIIDRQVVYPGTRNNRIDLLTLKRDEDGGFHFHVVEVKMGNNVELNDAVYDQLERYRRLIKENLPTWKSGYLKTVQQLRSLGFLSQLDSDLVRIGDKVDGSVAVFGYPNVAKVAIKQLKDNHPDVDVTQFSFSLPSGICH